MQDIEIAKLPVEIEDVAESRYINFVRIWSTAYDFRFLLSETILCGHTQEPRLRHVMRANLVMSPGHTKALLLALQEQIAQYERQNGEIKLPQQAAPVKVAVQ